VPEPFDGTEDLVQGLVFTSTNSGMPPSCGDGLCNGDETPDSCPSDCPACDVIPPAGRIVDESEPLCFTQFGTPTYWQEETAGYLDSLVWTTATEGPLDNYATWTLRFEQPGSYELEVYTTASFAQSEQAAYQVSHATGTTTVTIDQTAVDGWQSLGTFDFEQGAMAGGMPQQVRLEDATGEALGDMRQLVFDAVRVTGIDVGTGGTGGAGAGGQGSTGQGADGPASGAGGSASGGDADGDDGCGCMVVGDTRYRSTPLWLLAAVALLASRRRRRARPAVTTRAGRPRDR
jgi:MYXO-CTERM domain-containing protein